MTRHRRVEQPIPERLIGPVWDLWSHSGFELSMQMLGASMQPLFQEGDELIIEAQPKSIRMGDVAVYRHNGRCIAHRVVGRRRAGGQDLLLFKGDRVSVFDPPVPTHNILGRVVASRANDYMSYSWQLANVVIATLSATSGHVFRLYRAYLRPMQSRVLSRESANKGGLHEHSKLVATEYNSTVSRS